MSIRVTHVLGGAGVGGTERQLLLLLEAWQPTSIESDVLLIRGGPLEARFHELAPTLRLEKRGRIDPLFLTRLARELRRRRPEIVCTWGSTGNLWGAAAAVTARLPHLVVCERNLEDWKGPVLVAADKVIYRIADRVLGNAAAVVDAAIGRGALVDKTAVIPNAVRSATPPRTAARDEATLLLLARFDQRKGHDLLIEAVSEVRHSHPQVRARLVGPAVRPAEHAWEAQIRRRIVEAGLGQHIQIVQGGVEDPTTELTRATLLVAPSRAEGVPNTILEAMASGTPVVAAAAGGIPDVVHDGATGWLVPAEDPRALAAAISAALADPSEAARRAAAARELVETTLSPALVARQWEQLFRSVLHGRPGDTTVDGA